MEYDPGLWNTDPTRTVIHIDPYPPTSTTTISPQSNCAATSPPPSAESTPLLSGLHSATTVTRRIAEQRNALADIDEQARATPHRAGLNPAAVVLALREHLDDDATVACDVGSNYIYMARHFRGYEPRRLLFSNGQQTLGVALPWAMAAALVRPGTQSSRSPATAGSCSPLKNSRPPPDWA